MRIEIDQSGKIEKTHQDTILAFLAETIAIITVRIAKTPIKNQSK